jgi:signal transduction histidine kinase
MRAKYLRELIRQHPFRASLGLTCLLVAGTLSTFWLGYTATREWGRSTEESVRARGKEILALLSVALDQDMKGGQFNLLLGVNQVTLAQSSLYDLADRFAGGFARFPYIESVYIWKASVGSGGQTFLFNRSERVPAWDRQGLTGDSYPVVVRMEPDALRSLIDRVRTGAENGSPFAIAKGPVNGIPYQTVAHRIYADDGTLSAVVGYTVNEDWVRRVYFLALIQQIQKVSGDSSVRLEILDEANGVVAETGPRAAGSSSIEHQFPLAFSDRGLVADMPFDGSWPVWRARVNIASDATLVAARRGMLRTLALLGVGAAAAIIALLLIVRTAKAAATLASRQSDFVSAVTHEMKTPLSLITLASDSLASGRCSSPESTRDYGRLLANEARQLSLLIDNVLCYARLIDEDEAYSFDLVDLTDVAGESVERFRVQLADSGCRVHIDSPVRLPSIRGDRRMLRDALDNLLDNAIKYGGSGQTVAIKLWADDAVMNVDVSDRGDGIPPEELSKVFDKFQRGKGAEHKHRGSGLGLTIARRIIEAHRGRIQLISAVGQGTTVHIELPSNA